MAKLIDRLAEKFKLASKIPNLEFMLIDPQGLGKIYNFARNGAKTSVKIFDIFFDPLHKSS